MAIGRPASDLSTFEQVVHTDGRSLYSLAFAILGDRQDAEDAVQDTLELAWKSWQTLREPERRSVWLKRICLHRCLRVRRGFLGIVFLSERDPDPSPSNSRDPDLDRVFRRLSPHQRAVVTLHYHHGYKLDECAALLGCRPGTARSHLARALNLLRKELSDE
jgi:RNA polymerase sigma factor (sigma-70 family)